MIFHVCQCMLCLLNPFFTRVTKSTIGIEKWDVKINRRSKNKIPVAFLVFDR